MIGELWYLFWLLLLLDNLKYSNQAKLGSIVFKDKTCFAENSVALELCEQLCGRWIFADKWVPMECIQNDVAIWESCPEGHHGAVCEKIIDDIGPWFNLDRCWDTEGFCKSNCRDECVTNPEFSLCPVYCARPFSYDFGIWRAEKAQASLKHGVCFHGLLNGLCKRICLDKTGESICDVGVSLKELCGGKILEKRINIRVEHLKQSRSREDFLRRVKKNDVLRREAKSKGEFVSLRRQPEAPRKAHFVRTKHNTPELLAPIPFEEIA